MTKTDLIQTVSGVTDIPHEAVQRALDAMCNTIADAMEKGDAVVIPGFGSFVRKHRSARKGRNPNTGEEMDIPACDVTSFKPGKHLRDAVNTLSNR